MTALTMSLSQPVRAAASAAVAATVPTPASTSPAVSEVRYTQVSPEPALNVTTETVAAIQQLGSAQVPDEKQEQDADVRSFQEFQAQARRWERYYAHQPRRLEDLIAVYYGGLPGGQNASIDPRGPYPKDVVREVENADTRSGASEDEGARG